MKRPYFGILFIISITAIYFTADYFFGSEIVAEKIQSFIVIWLLIAYYAGQYSMKFPKE